MKRAVPLLLSLACAGANPPPATPAPADESAPSAESPATAAADAFHVRVVGAGKPMILIPGLACSGDVWRGAEQRFADSWQLHIVTLAGFAGQPPIEPPLMDTVRAALVRYIEAENLDAPVIVGHSLGAALAFAVAGSAPDRVGPVIALDGAPFGAALADPDATPDTVRPRAEMLRARVSGLPPEQMRAQAQLFFGPMITNPDDLQPVLDSAVQSDQATVAQAMYELMTTDARPLASAIRTPVLLLVAGHHFQGEANPDLSPWEQQLAAIPNHRVTVVPNARHFVMFDAPDFVYDEIERFLSSAR